MKGWTAIFSPARSDPSRVTTCPRCLYSGYLADFDELVALPPDFVQGLLGPRPLSSDAAIAPDADQRDIPPLTRYALAVEC